jgi:hypothetical protein
MAATFGNLTFMRHPSFVIARLDRAIQYPRDSLA